MGVYLNTCIFAFAGYRVKCNGAFEIIKGFSWYSILKGVKYTVKLKRHVDKFYKVLNVNNDSLIVMCVVLEGLLTDYSTRHKKVYLPYKKTSSVPYFRQYNSSTVHLQCNYD